MDQPCVLLVEDNPNDEELIRHALSSNQLPVPVIVVRDGAEALDYLLARGEYTERDTTDLPLAVLLDLNLPKLSGIDVLRAIRANPRTRLLPVVIFTSSGEDTDLADSYNNGANGYVVKPVEYAAFTEAVRQLGLYWTFTNHGPPAT